MNSLRLVLITRRYWPLVGGAETATANLARGLRRLGVTTTILTGRHDARWPADIVHREIPVHRLPHPAVPVGHDALPDRHVALAAEEPTGHRCRLRVAAGPEAHTAIGALAGSGIPVVIRAEADESFDLTHPAKTGRAVSRTLRRCRQAQAIVATTAQVEQRVLELGIDRHRILRISNGVNVTATTLALPLKTAARRALAGVNEDLRVPANQPVALCMGQLHPDNAWERGHPGLEAGRRTMAVCAAVAGG